MISLLHAIKFPNEVTLKNGVTVRPGDRLCSGRESYPYIEVVKIHPEDQMVELYSFYTTGTYLIGWESFAKFDYRKIEWLAY